MFTCCSLAKRNERIEILLEAQGWGGLEGAQAALEAACVPTLKF